MTSEAKGKSVRANRAGRPTSEELERRKRNIMQVATNLFVREGYAATSLVDIARGAGVATRTIYQHFGSKEEIFRDVMYARDTAAVTPVPVLAPNVSLEEAVLQAAEYACEVTFRSQTIDLMRLAVSESKRFPDMIKKLIDASNARFRANIKSIFDELVARDMIEDDDTARSADTFIHLIIGDTPLLTISGWNSSIPSREDLKFKARLFIKGRWSKNA